MEGTTISEATLRSTLTGSENVPITDSDLPVGRTTVDDLKNYISGGNVTGTNVTAISVVTELPVTVDDNTLYLVITED